MSQCRHSPRGEHYAPYVVDFDEFGNRRQTRRCAYCGVIQSLGPSSETDERVKVEIRAAELLTRYVNRGLSEHFRDWTLDELHGWRDWNDPSGECPCATAKTRHVANNWHAGYLARCIAEHGEGK